MSSESSAHHHGHAHVHDDRVGSRRFALAVALNLGFVGVEAGYGLWSGSLALLADAGHNLGDVFALGLAWGAHVLARRAPTSRRTYGMRRGTILASLGSAILLLIAVGVIAGEAVGRLFDPAEVPAKVIIGVAALGFVLNTATALLFVRHQHDLNVRAAFVHMAADAAISLGVVAGGILLMFTAWNWIDPVVSLVIGAVVAVSAFGLFRESLALAFDAVPRGIDPDAVRGYLLEQPGVTDVHDLHIWAMSTTEYALTAHLLVPDGGFGDERLHEAVDGLHLRFGIHHATLQVERGGTGTVCHATHHRL
jgi:cobalt-zinc-cadmium efflux system protein